MQKIIKIDDLKWDADVEILTGNMKDLGLEKAPDSVVIAGNTRSVVFERKFTVDKVIHYKAAFPHPQNPIIDRIILFIER